FAPGGFDLAAAFAALSRLVRRTALGPTTRALVREAEALMARDPRIANASVTGGFVYSDLPKCGMTVTVTARGGDLAAA
ncbi:M81 family metallopeptidase, partial [Acinetobacter baumannii]